MKSYSDFTRLTNKQEDYHFPMRHFIKKYTGGNKPTLRPCHLEIALYLVNVYCDVCPSDLSVMWKKCAVDLKHDLYLVSGCETDYILDNYPEAKFYEVR